MLRIERRPKDKRGFPIPWFVCPVEEGDPDFRVIRPFGASEAVRRKICWICGEPLGVHKAFVIGPLSALQKESMEPPCHRECAEYAMATCPFIAHANMQRSPRPHEQEVVIAAAVAPENPGMYCLWVTKSFDVKMVNAQTPSGDGVAFRLGEPDTLIWYRGGSPVSGPPVVEKLTEAMARLTQAFPKRKWQFDPTYARLIAQTMKVGF